MKVSELIVILSKLDQDKEIKKADHYNQDDYDLEADDIKDHDDHYVIN